MTITACECPELKIVNYEDVLPPCFDSLSS